MTTRLSFDLDGTPTCADLWRFADALRACGTPADTPLHHPTPTRGEVAVPTPVPAGPGPSAADGPTATDDPGTDPDHRVAGGPDMPSVHRGPAGADGSTVHSGPAPGAPPPAWSYPAGPPTHLGPALPPPGPPPPFGASGHPYAPAHHPYGGPYPEAPQPGSPQGAPHAGPAQGPPRPGPPRQGPHRHPSPPLPPPARPMAPHVSIFNETHHAFQAPPPGRRHPGPQEQGYLSMTVGATTLDRWRGAIGEALHSEGLSEAARASLTELRDRLTFPTPPFTTGMGS
jgi:hypothetical protein